MRNLSLGILGIPRIKVEAREKAQVDSTIWGSLRMSRSPQRGSLRMSSSSQPFGQSENAAPARHVAAMRSVFISESATEATLYDRRKSQNI